MKRPKLILFLIFSALFYFALSNNYYYIDTRSFLPWAQSLVGQGPVGFYERNIPAFFPQTYPPIAMFSLGLGLVIYNLIHFFLSLINQSYASNLANMEVGFMKVGEILSVMGIGFIFNLIAKTFHPKISKIALPVILFVLNPAVFYLSTIFGQIDLIPFFFAVLSLYFFLKKKAYWSVGFAALAALTKQLGIIYWILICILVFREKGAKVLLFSLLLSFGIFELVYFPFYPFSLTKPFLFYQQNLALVFPYASWKSINFWFLATGFGTVDDTLTKFFFFNLHTWGYILFLVSSLVITLIMFRKKITPETTIFFIFLISIDYFCFLTRMHSRYLIPSIVFASLLLYFNKSIYWLNYIFFTVLEMTMFYHFLVYPSIDWLAEAISSIYYISFLSVSYLFLLGYNIYYFYRLRSN